MMSVVAPGGIAVGGEAAVEEGAGVAGDQGKMTDEEEEGVAVVLVMGVVIQE